MAPLTGKPFGTAMKLIVQTQPDTA